MPKETFFNLPEEKRARILDEAVREFADNAYGQASVNRIVERAGIAKGSFYQYFEDKADLFKHIIQRIIEEKMAYITPMMLNPGDYGFFELIREMNRTGLAFAKDHPDYLAIGNRLLQDKGQPLYRQIMEENESTAYAAYEQLLRLAISRGEVREDIDVPFTARIIFALSAQIVELARPGTQDWTDTVIESLDKLMDFVERGITNTMKEGQG